MSKVAIIGSGPCGLSILRAFHQAEIKGEKIPDITCFDKQSDWGGLWNYSWRTGSDQYGDPVPNSMYRYLWSNGPKECLEFADYTFDEHFGKALPSFPPREVLYDYILGRAKKSDIKKYIRFDTTVTSVSHDGKEFSIASKDKKNNSLSSEKFDSVVIATGHFSVPFIPEYQGMKSFPGRILHSHDFRDADRIAIMKDGIIEQLDTPDNIVLHPATEYVQKFTEDIPREKVLKIESIMDPVDSSSSQSLTISKNAIIETVVESILNSKEIVTVIDPNKNNEAVGSLNPSKVVKVLFGDSKTNN